jgi:tRNA A37 threonylcarbamoyladenosine dehydratase
MVNNRTAPIALSSFLLGSAISYYFLSKNVNNKSESSEVSGSRKSDETNIIQIPPEIRSEQLSRNELYFGHDGMKQIEGASILVVGLGGVGSHTAHMLARAGAGFLRLVDFDQVTLSSLNRHACATLEDVGTSKVLCLKNFLAKICGNCCNVEARVQMYTGDHEKDGDMMTCPDGRKWDIIIDAIDDVPTKAKLVTHCVKENIRVLSCMGAGGKSDMTRLHFSDLKTASRDPLASKLRQTLRKIMKNDKELGLKKSFMEDRDQLAVLYSSEKTVVKLANFTDQQIEEGVHKFGAVDNMRIRVLPVLGTMPAIMGQSLAAMALCELGGKPFSPMSGERVGRNVRHKMFQHFKNRERNVKNEVEEKYDDKEEDGNIVKSSRLVNGFHIGQVEIDMDDVEYLLAEIWRNRCCVSGETLGTVLHLSRWDYSKPANCQNIVLLGVKAMNKFNEAFAKTGDGRESVPVAIRERVEARLATCKVDCRA